MSAALNVLKAIPQWVAWRLEMMDGKPTKVPYLASNGHRANVPDPASWTNFAAAAASYKKAGHRGLGFVVTGDDPYTGVDIDRCRDPETGDIAAWSRDIIARLDSYTEITPSSTGVRVWLKARKPGKKCTRALHGGKIEIYDRGRFFTVTGQHLTGTPDAIEDRQTPLDALYGELWPSVRPERPAVAATGALSADEILELARRAKNAAKWQRLLRGDTSECEGDDSRADAALCGAAAFYTRDPAVIDQIFRRSGLMREKWNRPDYRERTIQKALDLVTATYEPPGEIRGETRGAKASKVDPSADFALSLDEFIARKRETKPPLIGVEDDNLLPAGGLLIMFGRGGGGKSTLAIDAIFHLASGATWLGFAVGRPLRVLLIENEGPQEPFRRKLEKKKARWAHEIAGGIFIHTMNWGAFSLGDETTRATLRSFIEEERIDLVFGDPLASLGLDGVGSPDDTRRFMDRLVSVGLTRDVGFWLLHHPHKGETRDELDQASGDWGGKPDTMLMLGRLDGNRARLSFPKIRWGVDRRNGAFILAYDPSTEGFQVVATEQATSAERDLRREILDLLADAKPRTAREISVPCEEGGVGANYHRVGEVLDAHPESFRSFPGSQVGRSPNGTFWQVRGIGSDFRPSGPSEGVQPKENPVTGSQGHPYSKTGDPDPVPVPGATGSDPVDQSDPVTTHDVVHLEPIDDRNHPAWRLVGLNGRSPGLFATAARAREWAAAHGIAVEDQS